MTDNLPDSNENTPNDPDIQLNPDEQEIANTLIETGEKISPDIGDSEAEEELIKSQTEKIKAANEKLNGLASQQGNETPSPEQKSDWKSRAKSTLSDLIGKDNIYSRPFEPKKDELAKMDYKQELDAAIEALFENIGKLPMTRKRLQGYWDAKITPEIELTPSEDKASLTSKAPEEAEVDHYSVEGMIEKLQNIEKDLFEGNDEATLENEKDEQQVFSKVSEMTTMQDKERDEMESKSILDTLRGEEPDKQQDNKADNDNSSRATVTPSLKR